MTRNSLIIIFIVLVLAGCRVKKATVHEVFPEVPEEVVKQEAEAPDPEIEIRKELIYTAHTLNDIYTYEDTVRVFQWDKMKSHLEDLETCHCGGAQWVTLQNYKNLNGIAPKVQDADIDAYKKVTDKYGVDRYQSIPLYSYDNLEIPKRYGRDGALFRFLKDSADYIKVCSMIYDGSWFVPKDYVKVLDVSEFRKVVMVDRTNQNTTTLERGEGNIWYVRSMNPATTGLFKPPYKMETPVGAFVIQEHKPKMYYLVDGTSTIAGFAPWASRFTRGGYIHGVPINNPHATQKDYVEFSKTLGTTPRSHMCVRNATSHAKHIYEWATPLESLVVVFD